MNAGHPIGHFKSHPHYPFRCLVHPCHREGGLSGQLHLLLLQAPQPLRPLEEIRADILALEKETDGLLSEVLGSS